MRYSNKVQLDTVIRNSNEIQLNTVIKVITNYINKF